MGTLSAEVKVEQLRELYSLSPSTTVCIHEPTGKLYVRKILPAECAEQYRRIMSIENAHIARVGIDWDGAELNVFRPYMSGDTLQELIDSYGVLSVVESVNVALQLCDGLEALHKNGVIHRDVTSRNVLISDDGVVRLIDYGISRTYKADGNSDTVIMGTPGYAAPEQFGFAQSDPRTDIYALGVLLNVMVTGCMPSERTVQGKLGGVIKKCISIDASGRFSDVKALKRALLPLQGRTVDEAPDNVFNVDKKGVLDRIFMGMPGLRSAKKHVRIWASVGYVFAFIFLVSALLSVKLSVAGYVMVLASWFMMIVMPLFCFGNMFGFCDLIPQIRNSSEQSKRLFFNTVGWTCLLVGIMIYGQIPQA
jgi:hypothetical protein